MKLDEGTGAILMMLAWGFSMVSMIAWILLVFMWWFLLWWIALSLTLLDILVSVVMYKMFMSYLRRVLSA